MGASSNWFLPAPESPLQGTAEPITLRGSVFKKREKKKKKARETTQ